MIAGIGNPPEALARTFSTNVSAVNTYSLCNQKWFNQFVSNRVPRRVDAAFQQVGRVGHAAIQDIHEAMGKWSPDAAVGVAEKHAVALEAEAERFANLIGEKEYNKLLWFADWLRHALPIYAEKYRTPPWDEVLFVEQVMWIELTVSDIGALGTPWARAAARMLEDAGISTVRIVGTPDAAVVINEHVWHVQRKFFSHSVDLMDFLKTAKFQKHEITYIEMFRQLHAQGTLKHPPGHTKFDLLRKLDIPQHPDELSPPKACKCGAADGASELDMMAVHTKMEPERIKEHRQEELDKRERFAKRVEAQGEAYEHWLNRAFVRDDARVQKRQRLQAWTQILYDIGSMALLASGRTLPTPSEGWACSAYHKPCPYKGVCSGLETLDGPQFGDRPPSYFDIEETVE